MMRYLSMWIVYKLNKKPQKRAENFHFSRCSIDEKIFGLFLGEAKMKLSMTTIWCWEMERWNEMRWDFKIFYFFFPFLSLPAFIFLSRLSSLLFRHHHLTHPPKKMEKFVFLTAFSCEFSWSQSQQSTTRSDDEEKGGKNVAIIFFFAFFGIQNIKSKWEKKWNNNKMLNLSSSRESPRHSSFDCLADLTGWLPLLTRTMKIVCACEVKTQGKID